MWLEVSCVTISQCWLDRFGCAAIGLALSTGQLLWPIVLEPNELALVLVDHCGTDELFGRTSLQKVAYLCEAGLGWSGSGHRAYYYGPYSRDIDRAVNRLVRDGAVAETEEELGFTSPQGFVGKRYRYVLTGSGRTCLTSLEEEAPEDVRHVRRYADQVRAAAGDYNQRVLSLAAKTHYIVQSAEKGVSYAQISANAQELGWRISAPEIQRVAAILEKLKLASPASC